MENRIRKAVESVSLGVVLIISWIWLLTQATALFPENTLQWQIRIQIYLTITSLVLIAWVFRGNPDKSLFRVSFLKEFPKFLIFGMATIVLLVAIQTLIKGESLGSISTALGTIGLPTLAFVAFINAITEEIIFRRWLPQELEQDGLTQNQANIAQALIFAVFHFSLSGGRILILLPYVVLGLLFNEIRKRFSPDTQMANSGAHFGWNAFILAFIQRL